MTTPSIGLRAAARLALATAALAAGASAQMRAVGLAVGDVDGDGSQDVAIADPYLERDSGLGEVHVIDGCTGRELWRTLGRRGEFRAGLGVAVVTDHVAEPLVVTASRVLAGGTLRLDLHRGTDGALLCSFDLPATAEEFSCSLVPLDDLDHDGVAELAVGRRWYSSGADRHGRISVVSLRDGCESASLEGDRERYLLGLSLACGRFDAEPGADLVAAARVPGERGSSMQLLWFAGTTLREIGRTREPSPRKIGSSLAVIRDLDGDGFDETLVGARTNLDQDDESFLDEALVYDVRTASPLDAPRASFSTFLSAPFAVASLRDDSAGEPGLVASSPRESFSAGKWSVFGLRDVPVAAHCDDGDPNDWYGAAVGSCRIAGETRDRLVVVSERMDPRASYYRLCIEVECRTGPGWSDLAWEYALEPDAVRRR